MTKDNLTPEDIERLEKYLQQIKAQMEAGEQVTKSGFKEWLERMGLLYLIEKLSDAWEFILEMIGTIF